MLTSHEIENTRGSSDYNVNAADWIAICFGRGFELRRLD